MSRTNSSGYFSTESGSGIDEQEHDPEEEDLVENPDQLSNLVRNVVSTSHNIQRSDIDH